MRNAFERPTILLGAVGLLALKAVMIAAIYRRLGHIERQVLLCYRLGRLAERREKADG